MNPALREFMDNLDVDKTENGDVFELERMVISRVDLVDRGANKRRFLIVKGANGMAKKFVFRDGTTWDPVKKLDANLVENDDGSFTEVGKQGLSLSTTDKELMLSALTEAQERGAAALDAVRNATEDDGAAPPAEFVQEVAEIGMIYSGLTGGGESEDMDMRDPEEAEKAEGDEDPKAAAEDEPEAAAEPEEEVFKLSEDGDAVTLGEETFKGSLAKLASAMASETLGMTEEVQKAGRKIKGARLATLKQILGNLKKLVDDLAPGDVALQEAIDGVTKRFESRLEETIQKAVTPLQEENKKLREEIAKMAKTDADSVIPAGDSAGPGDGGRVETKKKAKRSDILYGVDLATQIEQMAADQ